MELPTQARQDFKALTLNEDIIVMLPRYLFVVVSDGYQLLTFVIAANTPGNRLAGPISQSEAWDAGALTNQRPAC